MAAWLQHSHFNLEKCAIDTSEILSRNSLTCLLPVVKNKNVHNFWVSSHFLRILGERGRDICFHSCCTWLSYLCLSCFKLSVEPRTMSIVRSSGATLSGSSSNTRSLLCWLWAGEAESPSPPCSCTFFRTPSLEFSERWPSGLQFYSPAVAGYRPVFKYSFDVCRLGNYSSSWLYLSSRFSFS